MPSARNDGPIECRTGRKLGFDRRSIRFASGGGDGSQPYVPALIFFGSFQSPLFALAETRQQLVTGPGVASGMYILCRINKAA
jgi:hypothetical protein